LDPGTLAVAAIDAALPYVVLGNEAATSAAGAAGESVWAWVKGKLTSAAGKKAVEDLENAPDDADNRKAAEVALSKLLETDPGTFVELSHLVEKAGFDIAWSLHDLGSRSSDPGGRKEVLAAIREAVDICQHLAKSGCDSFLGILASNLHRLGSRLSDLGRREEALAASQDAVDLYRRLWQSGRDYPPEALPISLSTLGQHLSDLGRREEALAASQEAVGLYRHLAESRGVFFLPYLAGSLVALGNHLSDLDRSEEALAASQEAVDIFRVARTVPEDLPMSLRNLGKALAKLGRREEALAASQEAVDMMRHLAFSPTLAKTLRDIGRAQSDYLEWSGQAQSASQSAADAKRRVAETRPDALMLHYLAMSLGDLGSALAVLGRREEALAASQEAIDIHRQLAQTHADAFLPDLASTISERSDVLAALDRPGEAAQAAAQALEILAPFVERYTQAYRWARNIADQIRRYSETAGQQPDNVLLARVERALAVAED
jgi:tetratricopeptide (TPR) repeat protein